MELSPIHSCAKIIIALRNKHRRSSKELDAFHALSQTLQLVGRVGGEQEREKLAFPDGRPHHGTLLYGPVLHGKERYGESLARNNRRLIRLGARVLAVR